MTKDTSYRLGRYEIIEKENGEVLSSCRKSCLPEWHLIFVTMMVFLGLMAKFKVTPKWMRRSVYRLHTGLATFSIMIILLVVVI